jgi:hypothetical protein
MLLDRPAFSLRLVVDPADSPVESEGDGVLWILRRPERETLDDLRARGQSFVALNGKVRLQRPGVLIDRTDLSRLGKITASARRSAFSDRASLIPRWLFNQPLGSEWTVGALAESTGVSPSVASYAVKDLALRQLIDREARGRERRIRLRDPIRLIEQWAREYDWLDNPSLSVNAPIGSRRRFLQRLATIDLPRFAATLQGAASLSLPHAPVEQLQLYLDASDLDSVAEVARTVGWPEDPAGNLRLMLPHYRESLWEGVTERVGVPVVSDVQLVLDLWNHPARGREQAELVLEKHLAALSGL